MNMFHCINKIDEKVYGSECWSDSIKADTPAALYLLHDSSLYHIELLYITGHSEPLITKTQYASQPAFGNTVNLHPHQQDNISNAD